MEADPVQEDYWRHRCEDREPARERLQRHGLSVGTSRLILRFASAGQGRGPRDPRGEGEGENAQDRRGKLTFAPISPIRRPLGPSSLVRVAGGRWASELCFSPQPPRTDLGGLQKIQTTLRECKSQLAAKGKAAKEDAKKKLWSDYSTELESSINVLGNFVDDCYCQIAIA